MAKKPTDPKKSASTKSAPAKMGWRKQLIETYKISRKSDPSITWWMLGAFVVFGAVGFGVFYVVPSQGGTFRIVLAVIGLVVLGTLGTLVVFSRRAQRAAYTAMEDQLGSGARALSLLRRGWKTDEVVAFTKQQDMVHRVVGPPGIVLVGEGNAHRLRQLMLSERKKHERVASETPIHEVLVGRGEGQVPLPKLVRHIQKMGREVKPAEMTDILARLKALDSQRPKIPMPRGPVPTSMRGLRQNMKGR